MTYSVIISSTFTQIFGQIIDEIEARDQFSTMVSDFLSKYLPTLSPSHHKTKPHCPRAIITDTVRQKKNIVRKTFNKEPESLSKIFIPLFSHQTGTSL
jgi:hypothetical protein